MKKLLGAVIAAALLFPPGPASAELFKNLKVVGQVDLQANSAHNVSDFATRQSAGADVNDRIENVVTRLLLGLQWNLLDDVTANVMLRKNDRAWGTAGSLADSQLATAAGGSTGNQSLAGGNVGGNLFVQQANVKVDKVFGHVDSTLGRQFYGRPGDLVIFYGPYDTYGLFVSAVDGARFEFANDWLGFSGLAGQTAQNAALAVAAGTSQNPTNVVGFDATWKMLPINVVTGLWNRTVKGDDDLSSFGGRNDRLYVARVAVRGEAMGGWFNVDLAQNFGDCRSQDGCSVNAYQQYRGHALLADLGWKGEVANVGGLTPWLNFGYGSGAGDNQGAGTSAANNMDFQSINSDYRPGIINRRFPDAFVAADGLTTGAVAAGTRGLANRRVVGAGVKFTPAAADKLTVGLSGWDYRRNRALAGAANSNLHIGYEYGVTADWKHSDNVAFGFGWARFVPKGFIEHENRVTLSRPLNSVNLAFADLTVKFD